MILKRQEKENVVKALYDSSNIIASVWDKEKKELILIFNKGTRYKYPNVSSTDYLRFETADSQGKVFNTHLKNYTAEKIENVDPDELIKEVHNLKEQEEKEILKAKSDFLMVKVKGLITSYENTNGELNNNQLNELKETITTYINETSNK